MEIGGDYVIKLQYFVKFTSSYIFVFSLHSRRRALRQSTFTIIKQCTADMMKNSLNLHINCYESGP